MCRIRKTRAGCGYEGTRSVLRREEFESTKQEQEIECWATLCRESGEGYSENEEARQEEGRGDLAGFMPFQQPIDPHSQFCIFVLGYMHVGSMFCMLAPSLRGRQGCDRGFVPQSLGLKAFLLPFGVKLGC